MYIELNDRKASIVNLEYAVSMKFDNRFKRIIITFRGTKCAEEVYEYITDEELFNDKHRIKNKVGL